MFSAVLRSVSYIENYFPHFMLYVLCLYEDSEFISTKRQGGISVGDYDAPSTNATLFIKSNHQIKYERHFPHFSAVSYFSRAKVNL
jgi:hypothetical protein